MNIKESTLMTPHGPDPKSIFSEALERPSGPERTAFLDGACRGNEVVRTKVDALVAAFDQAGRYLAVRPEGAAAANPGRDNTVHENEPASRHVDSDDDHTSETDATDAHRATETSDSKTLPSPRTAARTIAHSAQADLAGQFVGGRAIAGRYSCGKFSARAGWAPCIVLIRRSRSGGRWR
jgi:hypothetical protein